MSFITGFLIGFFAFPLTILAIGFTLDFLYPQGNDDPHNQ